MPVSTPCPIILRDMHVDDVDGGLPKLTTERPGSDACEACLTKAEANTGAQPPAGEFLSRATVVDFYGRNPQR